MVSAIVAVAFTSAAAAQLAAPADPGYAAMEAQQNAANTKAGPRVVPGRMIPVPNTVSPQLQASIAAPYRLPAWNADPKTTTEWKALTRIMHHLPRFCMPGPHAYCTRTPSIRPVWIGGVNSLCNACGFDLP